MFVHRLLQICLLLGLTISTACSNKQSGAAAAEGGSGRDAGGLSSTGTAAKGGNGGETAAHDGGAAGAASAGTSGGAGSGGAADGGGDAALPSGTKQATQSAGSYFPQGAPWYTDVHDPALFPKASDSDAITQWMVSHAGGDGWGGGNHIFQIDFSLAALEVPAGTVKRTFQTGPSGFHADPDCDTVAVPVPVGGVVEGNDGASAGLGNMLGGYQCSGFDAGDDCHILLVARSEHRLYELYHATIDATGTFYAGCLALWDTSKVYDQHGRGDQCTSADAAGFPIAPLLFTAEEIKAGAIHHAIRFAIPNDMIRQKKYVPPATHGTNTTGPLTSMPYGAHLRMKTPYAGMASLSDAAKVVVKALQTYGMYMADGGNIPLMGQSDAVSTLKWAEVGLDSRSLKGIKATDFEVLAYPTPTDVTDNCQRTPITQ